MRRILCTGDSHTWGQGAAGLLESLSPPAMAGDLRPADFACGCYVNRLRERLNARTGSRAREWSAPELAALPGIGFAAPCAVIGETPLRLSFSGSLLRVFCGGSADASMLEAAVDGRVQRLDLRTEQTENAYRPLTLHLPEGPHEAVLRAAEGTVRLYRAESYEGPLAVLNAGIGSCPTFRYRETYWEQAVAAARPDITLMEAHTINDWLAGDPPAAYEERLREMIGAFQSLGSTVILLTVAPVAGPQQVSGTSASYGEYVEASRRAARRTGIPLCDANAVMSLCLEGLSEKEAAAYLYADNWHVNDRGHALYAQLLGDTLEASGLLKPAGCA